MNDKQAKLKKLADQMTDEQIDGVIALVEAELTRRAAEAERARQQELEQQQRREASAAIAEKLQQIDALYRECAAIAAGANISFDFSTPDGTSGWYDSSGWQNSSSSC